MRYLIALSLIFGLVGLARAQTPLKVLLVPGHDATSVGTQHLGVKEADLNLALARELYELLNNDTHFHVVSTRDLATGDYNYSLARYFEEAFKEVNNFRQTKQSQYRRNLETGQINASTGVPHNFASEDVAYKLHAINKWANDQDFDLVLHLHFNDHTGRPRDTEGDYSGFAIYVPERQFANASSSRAVAEALLQPLLGTTPKSNLPLENAGIVEEQDLIAIGAYNSRSGPSLLIEYGYIYEPALSAGESIRQLYLQELAYQSYRGLRAYLGLADLATVSTLWPQPLTSNLRRGMKNAPEVLRLQRALQLNGFYPPPERFPNECPLSGTFGPCTLAAVTSFQSHYNIPATGLVGPLTRAKLNSL